MNQMILKGDWDDEYIPTPAEEVLGL